jgi:hypothetical protein
VAGTQVPVDGSQTLPAHSAFAMHVGRQVFVPVSQMGIIALVQSLLMLHSTQVCVVVSQ